MWWACSGALQGRVRKSGPKQDPSKSWKPPPTKTIECLEKFQQQKSSALMGESLLLAFVPTILFRYLPQKWETSWSDWFPRGKGGRWARQDSHFPPQGVKTETKFEILSCSHLFWSPSQLVCRLCSRWLWEFCLPAWTFDHHNPT